MKRINLILASLGVVFILAGCGAQVKPEQPVTTTIIRLEEAAALGQSFVASEAGLQGIGLYLKPVQRGSGEMVLQLRTSTAQDTPMREARRKLETISAEGYYVFNFPPLADSSGQDYYLHLRLRGPGALEVGAANPEQYAKGSAYIGNTPQEAQLAFFLVYDRLQLGLGLAREGGAWLGWLLLGAVLFVIPGLALLAAFLPGWERLYWAEIISLAVGISLSIYPALMAFTYRLGIQLGAGYAWLPLAAGSLALVWQNRLRLTRLFKGNHPTRQQPIDWGKIWEDGLLVILIGLIFASRLWAIRNIDAPLWGDSYQHTMMAQLMFDNGGLFSSWQPYAPYVTMSTHFGFHSVVALFLWLSGMPARSGTLVVGQLLNGLAVVSLIPLALRLGKRNRWAGLTAVLAAGLLSPTPGFYVNWGRYAQLAGQVILPTALWLAWETVAPTLDARSHRKTWGVILLAGLSLTGATLAYYRMPMYYASFLLAWLACWGISHWKLDWRRWGAAGWRLLAVGVVGILFFLPWLPQMAGGNLSEAAVSTSANQTSLASVIADYQSWRSLNAYIPSYLVAVSLAGALFSLARRKWWVAGLVLWVALLSAYISGQLIGLPGSVMIQSFAIMIALYIPVALLCGWLASELLDLIPASRKTGAVILLGVLFLILAVWGGNQQRHISQPENYALVTRPDLRAMEWMRANLPADSTILVEGFRVANGVSAVGSDGGWWIPLLALRQNSMPPQYALVNETASPPEYSTAVVELVATLEEYTLDSQKAIQALCAWGITHVYTGQSHGLTGFGASQLYAPQEMDHTPAYSLLYRQDRVSVHRFNREVCSPEP